MNRSLMNIATLAFCIALPDFIIVRQNCRMKTLMKRLEKESIKALGRQPELTDADKALLGQKIEEFRVASGWGNRSRHLLTYASFCLALLEDTRFDRITKTMVEIVDYFDRVGKAPGACYPAGALAKEKWEAICAE